MRKLTYILILSGIIVQAQETFDAAQKAFDRAEYSNAYSLFKEASEEHIQANDAVVYVQCNLLMSECKILTGEPNEARQIAENTLAYLDEYFPKQQMVRGQALTLQGRSYLNLGRNDLALEYLNKADALLGDLETLEKASCWSELGIVFWNNGNLELARQYVEKGLSIRQKELSSTDPLIGDSFNKLGLLYQESEPLQALIYFNRALKIFEKNYGESHSQIALVANNLAFAYAAQGEYDEAFKQLDRVKATLEKMYPGNHQRKAFNLSTIGRLQQDQGKLDAALVSQTQALKMYIILYGTKHPEVANTYFLMGEIYTKQGEYKTAVDHLQKSIYANLIDQNYASNDDLPEIRDYFNADILLSSLQSKAIAQEALHYEKTLNKSDLTGSIASYEKCDEMISIIRQLRQNERDKLKLGVIAKEVYENGMRLSLILSQQTFKKQYYLEKAFQFCERSKSAVLLEAITETKAKSFAGIPQELITLEDSLKAEIAFFEQQLASGSGQTKFKDLLFQYQSAYHDFIDRLEAEYPAYYELKYSQQLASVKEIQSAIGPDATLLSYFVGEKAIYLFQINNKGITAYNFPKAEDFEKQATGFRNAIKYKIEESVISGAKKLHAQVLPDKLNSTSTLIILPDGVLGTLPFEAFIHPDSEETTLRDQEFLIKKYAIAYDYSATLLVSRYGKTNDLPESILLCAPLNFDKNEVKMVNLPDSEKEVKEIRLFFMANGEAELSTGVDASEALLKSDEIKKYKYLHFATHGQVNESKPELSRIFLAPSADQDGSLYAGEIYNLKINADLVTLSACETGLGKIAKGEGIVGLSRALQYAGANNLIVSLWQVADQSTAQLMIKFYDQQLHNNYEGYNRALREAKLSLLNSDKYQHPYYWAPFILVGF
jgi:CHAT domain-containing protein